MSLTALLKQLSTESTHVPWPAFTFAEAQRRNSSDSAPDTGPPLSCVCGLELRGFEGFAVVRDLGFEGSGCNWASRLWCTVSVRGTCLNREKGLARRTDKQGFDVEQRFTSTLF